MAPADKVSLCIFGLKGSRLPRLAGVDGPGASPDESSFVPFGQRRVDRMQLEKDMTFIHEVDKPKNVIRKTRNVSNERFENDAEHSWHVCMMAMALQTYSNVKVDL